MNEVKYGQSASEYHAFPALNKSSIDKILDCPLKYKLYMEGERPEPTASMKFGTMCHCLVLEPEKFQLEFHVMENKATSSAGKKEAEACQAAGQTPVSAADYAKACLMRDNLYAHPEISNLLALPGDAEVSLYWEMVSDASGEVRQCKARCDAVKKLSDGSCFILDLKTTSGEASLDDIAKHCAGFGYHRQDAWYQYGLEACGMKPAGFFFIFTSTQAPHLCNVVQLAPRAKKQGWWECQHAMEILEQCEAQNRWPGYPAGIEEGLDLPLWYYRNVGTSVFMGDSISLEADLAAEKA